MKALELIDQKGRHLGSIAEVILDINSGRVIAVSLLVPDQVATSSSEVLVIPWHSVRFDDEFDCLRLVECSPDTINYPYGDGLVN